jgi:adenosine 3'-phospho 5'-phosphosulfate transporter B3
VGTPLVLAGPRNKTNERGGGTRAMAIDVPSSLLDDNNENKDDQPLCNRSNANDASGSSSVSHTKSSITQAIVGLFVFYIFHDALQERMFQFEGYEYGFFMTLAEVSVMLLLSVLSDENGSRSDLVNASTIIGRRHTSNTRQTKKKKKTDDEQCKNKIHTNHHNHNLSFPTLLRLSQVGILLALSHGLGNTSLNYSPYPLKVAFKSCKLVPTMILSACCVTGGKNRYHHHYTVRQYMAALIMGLGLAILTAADNGLHSGNAHHFVAVSAGSSLVGSYIGPILLGISVIFDSIIPTLQEQLLQGNKRVQPSLMILVSNAIMCIVLLGYTFYSGELVIAYMYCTSHPSASIVLLAQGICAYLGLRCYLIIIRDYGGVIGVLLANARKVVTIILSFILFAKPFHIGHGCGLGLVCLGVYLGSSTMKTMSKKKKGMKEEKWCDETNIKNGIKAEEKSVENQSHEHNV